MTMGYRETKPLYVVTGYRLIDRNSMLGSVENFFFVSARQRRYEIVD
jgi:hypothetical protein